MIETGQILQQRYRIDRQIGQGGMGAVYVATDERFNSTVAIKETLCMDDNYRRAIEREARLLNSLKHNALPRVTDHFLEADGQFLVMEYIPGEDLCHTLDERSEPFAVDLVLDWADQLLDALEFLHSQESPVIHRDIKPQNLKITPKGQIVLLDFGLAKGNVTGAGNQTNAKSIFGYSRNYASLEQIQGTGTDPRSDLYSLAATLYHLLTKAAPEDALTRAMCVLSAKPDPLVPANQLRSEIPAGVAAILHKALDLDAAERPESAAEMRRMLRDHESYADLAYSTVSVARGTNQGDIHSQPTRLMPVNTLNDELRATQARTNVISGGDVSQVTRIRPLVRTGDAASSGTRKKRGFAVAAAAALLLAGSVIGGVMVYSPEIISGKPEQPFVEVEDPLSQMPPPAAPSEETEEAEAISDANPGAGVGKSEQAPKKTETTKATVKSDPKRAADADPDDDEKVVIDGDNIRVGNMRIKDGKVYMSDGTVYPARGLKRNPPPGMTEEQIRELERLRRLRIMQRQHPEIPIPPTPKPNQ